MGRAGAVIDVTLPSSRAEGDRIVTAWRTQARRILDALGWGAEEQHDLRFPGGASLAFTAPADVLYTATEINEWAWDAALAVLSGLAAPPIEPAVATLSARIARERNPRLLVIRDAARRHGAQLFVDHQVVSAGEGTGSIAWPAARLPNPDQVPWERVHDVPVALVTGSNGKTTTVRLLAAIVARSGRVCGYTCTDGVFAAGEALARGDYAGPEGARMLLRDSRVETAVLETARGGLLRRGLAVVVDFAHNPPGMAALADIAAALPARRRLVAIGQASDRDDDAIRELARAAFVLRPDHVIVKEMEKYRRGRAPGEVPGLLGGELRRLGLPDSAVSNALDDLGALHQALGWARPGDLLLLTVHVDQQAALGWLERIRREGWEPGRPLPR